MEDFSHLWLMHVKPTLRLRDGNTVPLEPLVIHPHGGFFKADLSKLKNKPQIGQQVEVVFKKTDGDRLVSITSALTRIRKDTVGVSFLTMARSSGSQNMEINAAEEISCGE